jgi:hypothetical protein
MGQRSRFREACVERDGGECVVPWCKEAVTPDPSGPGEQHHVLERKLWKDGGYIPENGASVCNTHHRYAETNHIPPQAFWRWIGVDEPVVPEPCDSLHVNKWGEPLDTPPWKEHRERIKYPSTRHLLPCYWQSEHGTADERTGRDDTGMTSTASFVGAPYVMTVKLDGANSMMVKDLDEPVRARNGKDAEHESFDMLKQLYWDKDVYSALDDNIQVFGEWMYAKHSIHYGCDCDEACESVGPQLDSHFYVFGVYDTDYDVWLSWPETNRWGERIDFPVAPTIGMSIPDTSVLESTSDFVRHVERESQRVIDQGHEGTIVRSKFPFHYGQFEERVGKFTRCNHVQTDKHWSHKEITRNKIERFK